jgi:hypothetical protein
MLTVLGGLAEFECDLIRSRTGEGQSAGPARGQKRAARHPASTARGDQAAGRGRGSAALDRPQLQCQRTDDFEAQCTGGYRVSQTTPLKLFFSWQADAPTGVCRNFIEKALKQALVRVVTSIEVESAVREVGIGIDRDTLDTAGWAPIVDTIFKKIDDAAVFVPDLTFVATRLDGQRPAPNPNVLVECGWALKSLTYERILPIMNVRFGSPNGDALPFNMRHLRHPIQYDLDESASEETRRGVREKLVTDIASALRPILSLSAVKALLPQPRIPEPFRAAVSRQRPSRFRADGQPIGFTDGAVGGGAPVTLIDGPAMWLRLMPQYHSGVTHPAPELRECMQRQTLLPFLGASSGYGYLRADDGYGMFAIGDNERRNRTPAVVFAFENGEIWSVNSMIIQCVREVPYRPVDFVTYLDQLASFLRDQLKIPRPYRWIAGIEGVNGRPLVAGQTLVGFVTGHCVADLITEEGMYSEGDSGAAALRPFFAKILEKCGVAAANMDRLLPTG